MTSRQLIRSSTAIALVVFVCALTIGADAPPADVLKSNGLTKVGSLYLLDADVKLSDSLRELRRAETLLQSYTTKRRGIEADVSKAEQFIVGWEREKVALHEELSKTSTAQTQRYNEIIGEINKRNSEILEAAKYMEDRAAALKKLEAPTDHISVTLALTAKLEDAQKQYDLLAAKEEIKSALAMLNEKSPIKFHLGPSATFKDHLTKLRRQRDAINNAVIKFEIRGGVPHVPTILNGTVVVPMVVDSGASLVTITSEVAKQLKLSASADAASGRTSATATSSQHLLSLKAWAYACAIPPAPINPNLNLFIKIFTTEVDIYPSADVVDRLHRRLVDLEGSIRYDLRLG